MFDSFSNLCQPSSLLECSALWLAISVEHQLSDIRAYASHHHSRKQAVLFREDAPAAELASVFFHDSTPFFKERERLCRAFCTFFNDSALYYILNTRYIIIRVLPLPLVIFILVLFILVIFILVLLVCQFLSC